MLSSYFRSINSSASNWFVWARSATLNFVFYSLVILLILWISIFLYGSFYYAYMPTVEHVRPVHLQYSDCTEGTLWKTGCSYPTANVTLLDHPSQRQQFLMRGQVYKVLLNLEMPQSPVNEDVGVFMVKISFYADGDETVSVSSRPAMLHFKSSTLKLMETVVMSPLLIGGFSEEKQVMEVELHDKFQDSPYKPTIGAVIEVQSKNVQIYSSVLRIQARFSGLRYLMFEWPILTAAFGVGTNFMILMTVAVISWLRLFNDEEQEGANAVVRPHAPDFGHGGQHPAGIGYGGNQPQDMGHGRHYPQDMGHGRQALDFGHGRPHPEDLGHGRIALQHQPQVAGPSVFQPGHASSSPDIPPRTDDDPNEREAETLQPIEGAVTLQPVEGAVTLQSVEGAVDNQPPAGAVTLPPVEGAGNDGNASTSSCESSGFERIDRDIILQEHGESASMGMAPEGSHVRLRHGHSD